MRITLGVPRGVRLPDPRFGGVTRWPSITELAPKREYRDAPDDVFNARFLDQLDSEAETIDVKLRAIHPGAATVVLCCFEQRITDPGEVTLATYAHFFPDDDDRAREILGSFFRPTDRSSARNVPGEAR